MNNIWYVRGLGGILVLMVFVGMTNAEERYIDYRYRETASGNFVSSVIDTNGDGIPGVSGLVKGRSTFGSVTISFFSEFDLLDLQPSDNCPDDYLQAPLVSSRSIYRYSRGDLLYVKTTSQVFCGNLETGDIRWTETQEVIGGTGRFANAKGTFEVSGSGTILIFVDGLPSFGGMTFSGEGEISLDRTWGSRGNSGQKSR